MDLEFVRATSLMLVVNLIYAVVALFVGVLAVRMLDKLILKRIDLEEEIQKGNIAATSSSTGTATATTCTSTCRPSSATPWADSRCWSTASTSRVCPSITTAS